MKRKKPQKKNKQEKWKNDPARNFVALSLVPGLGAQRIRLLLEMAGHPRDIFRMPQKRLQTVRGIGPATAKAIASFGQWEEADRLLEAADTMGARILTCQSPLYPALLKEIYDPPPLLWVKGDPAVLDTDGIAVVGTRRATRYGKKMASRFASGLARVGLTVVSGLAYGIDAEAHRATLGTGGKTVAVLGSGLDVIYPARHAGLAQQIIESGGAVISEFPPGTSPEAGHFPVRNRIVSGLTLGTLVVESGREGGSMITAKSALDQNREVFVIPHSLENRAGIGCNSLIKRGMGKLVDSVVSILEEIRFRYPEKIAEVLETAGKPAWTQLGLDEFSVRVCTLLEEGPDHLDSLAGKLNVPVHVLLKTMLELEMLGCVRQRAGKIFELS